MSKQIRIALVAVLAAAAAVIGAAPAAAAWGTTGAHSPAEATCFNREIIVHAPHIRAVPVNHGGNVLIVGPSHTQWVAYRAWVYHVESGQWSAGSWKARQATDDGWASLMSDSWYDYSARRFQSGATSFTINSAGRYFVYVQYYWFADQYVGAGGDAERIAVHDYNGGLGTTDLCRF